MQTACLYIRVSTDEQARKGYSLPVQGEALQKFCASHEIRIISTIVEDYSAMTFKRPAWTRLTCDLNRYKSKRPDFILFTRWDRFSRNIADAYYVIRLLGNLGIEPQAIDQPLDLTVPENKLMLAIYIAIAEVENDRRIINVKQSIHKARLEGRWTSHAPLGYSSQWLNKVHRCIVPKEPEASLIKEAFRLITLEKQRSVQSVFEELVGCGLQCSDSQFWRILRNKVYCGMVKVPAHDGYKSYWLKGLHEALISESLFRQVQQRLDHKKKSNVIISNPNEKLFLRGFVYCPKCGKRLTGIQNQRKKKLPYEQTKVFVQTIGIKTWQEYWNWSVSGERPSNIPAAPDKAYFEFEGWGKFLGTDRIANQNKEFWSYDEAKDFLAPLKIKTKSEFITLCKDGTLPNEIPGDPALHYKRKEAWTNYKDFFGKE